MKKILWESEAVPTISQNFVSFLIQNFDFFIGEMYIKFFQPEIHTARCSLQSDILVLQSYSFNRFGSLSVKLDYIKGFDPGESGRATYPVHPLLRASLAMMYLPSLGRGYFVMPSAEYSAGDDLDISLLAQRFSGEFEESREKLNMLFVRFRLTF